MYKLTTVVGALVLIGALGSCSYYASHGTVDYVKSVSIQSTERQCNSTTEGSDCKYMVFTENEVFENSDDLFQMKFNSSDIQSSLIKAEKSGSNCDLKVNGWRIQFLSAYRNVLEADCREE